uniref:Uncharacterized protein n=1 Tax=viral metagenome TaxID=1070528 RepID=A0A6C0ENJ0_9ZZZZ
MTTLASGQIIPQAPALHTPPVQDLEGSALEAASKNTLASNAKLAETAKAMGAGQKGSSRRKKRTARRGGADSLNAHIPSIPEAGTIRGVSHAQNHLTNVNNINQIRADASGDKLMNAQPYDPTPTGGRRTKRHRKAKNGRRNNRTHRRGNRKSTSRGGRSRRSVLGRMAKSK